MSSADFRKDLVKLLPGYDWTVHHPVSDGLLVATGIQTSGFNRLSTVVVERREKPERVEYTARSAGFGRRAPWLHTYTDATLARTIRGLQAYYETQASTYRSHALALRNARAPTPNKEA